MSQITSSTKDEDRLSAQNADYQRTQWNIHQHRHIEVEAVRWRYNRGSRSCAALKLADCRLAVLLVKAQALLLAVEAYASSTAEGTHPSGVNLWALRSSGSHQRLHHAVVIKEKKHRPVLSSFHQWPGVYNSIVEGCKFNYHSSHFFFKGFCAVVARVNLFSIDNLLKDTDGAHVFTTKCSG